MRRIAIAGATATTLLLTASLAHPQGAPTVTTLDRFTRMGKQSVTVVPGSDPGRPLVLDAAGGDIFLLEYDAGAQTGFRLLSQSGASPVPPNFVSTGGVVVDVSVVGDHIYAATFREGLAVFDMAANFAPEPCGASGACWLAPEGHDVRCVSAADVDGGRIIVVGTENRIVPDKDTPDGGAIFVLEHDLATGLVSEINTFDVGRAVLTLAVSTQFPFSVAGEPGANLTVLLGTHCARQGAKPAPLQRRDLRIAYSGPGGQATCDPISLQWWTTNNCDGLPKNMIIRDIVIDGAAERAYVAASNDGVYAFELDPSTSCPHPTDPNGLNWGLCPAPSTFVPQGAGSPCLPCPDSKWPIHLPAFDVIDGACLDHGCSSSDHQLNCDGQPVEMLNAIATALSIVDADGPGDRYLSVGWGHNVLLDFNTAGLFRAVTSERTNLEPTDYSATETCGSPQYWLSVHTLVAGQPQRNDQLSDLIVPDALMRLISPVQSVTSLKFGGKLHVIAARRINATEAFLMTPANPGNGCDNLPYELEPKGNWGEHAPGYVSGNVVLDVQTATVIDPVSGAPRRNLYLSTERNVLELWLDDASDATALRTPRPPSGTPTFPSNPDSPPRAERAAIRMAVAPEQGLGTGARLFATTDRGRGDESGGVRVFDISQPGAPTVGATPGRRELSRGGLGYQLAVAPGLGSGQAPSDKRYVYVPFRAGQHPELAGIKVWDLGSANNPVDPRQASSTPWGPGDNNVCYSGSFSVPGSPPINGIDIDIDGIAVWGDAASGTHYAYALYGQATDTTATGPIGLLALKVTLDQTTCTTTPYATGDLLTLSPAGPGHSIGANPAVPGFYQADDVCDGCRPVRGFDFQYYPTCLRIDSQAQRLYGAWVGVLAMWSISDPEHPTLLAVRDMTGFVGAYGMTPWCSDIEIGAVVAETPYIYLAFTSDGLGILDVSSATSFATGPLTLLEMPWQTPAIAIDPSDGTRRHLFVGSGSAGVDWIKLEWP